MREQTPRARAAIEVVVAAYRAREEAIAAYNTAVVAASRAGASQVAIARAVGLSSEGIRQTLDRYDPDRAALARERAALSAQ